MNKTHSTITDYGYYTIPNSKKIYFNKFEALFDLKEGEYPNWNYNEEFFSKFNWSVEPVESIDVLYARRMAELRNKYDYLVLHLSGGWDSGNILATAMQNNIFIDEIMIRGPMPQKVDANDLSPENQYSECYLSAYPLAKKAKEQWPALTITVMDTKDVSAKFFETNPDWFTKVGHLAVGMFRYDLDQLSPTVINVEQKYKTVGHLVGVDKPRIHLDKNNNYFFSFLDLFINIHIGQRLTSIDVPMAVELFYWAPTVACANIMIKQSHILKNYYKLINQNPSKIKWTRREHDIVGSLIYPSTTPPIWVSEKVGAIAEFDNWLYKDPGSTICKHWENGLEYLYQNVPKYLQNLGNLKQYGLMGAVSGRYNLGD